MRAFASMIVRFFGVLAALALLLAPLSIAEASSVAPSHERMMAQNGDCHMPMPGRAHRDRMDGKLCCMALSLAVSAASAPAPLLEPSKPSAAALVLPTFGPGFLGEIATPPPRRS